MSETGDDLPQTRFKQRKYDIVNDSSQSKAPSTYKHIHYTVAWICALEIELIAALEMLDEGHRKLPQPSTDHNVYHLGSIGDHNVVIVATAHAGNVIAATVVTQMRMTFPNVQFGLLVGIGGGVPVMTEEGIIRLGHVVVSKPAGLYSGVIQYDHGKAEADKFVRTGALAPPPPVLLQAAQALGAQRARSEEDPLLDNIRRINTAKPGLRCFQFPGIENDHLYQAEYTHVRQEASCGGGQFDSAQKICRNEDGMGDMVKWITVHRGTIASGELVLRDAAKRDNLGKEYGVLCFEMEAAGVLNDFSCLVIRGISDYCDSHKNDQWHGFAAAAAAAYARQLFFHMPVDHVIQLIPADDPGIKRVMEKSDELERQEIAEWISSIDYAASQAENLDKRQKGTGLWLLEKTEFREWVKNKGVLYCPGIPGAGKTILSSIIIKHLQESVGIKQDVGIAYFFFDYRQKSEQKLVTILGSILKQLVQKLQIVPDDLKALYRRFQHDRSRPQRDDLLKSLVTAANSYSRVYLVVDALDECLGEERTRDKVISHILDLQENCNISLFATSRSFFPDIAAKFEPFPSVEIRANDTDVALFVEEHVHEISNCVRNSPELSKLVIFEIVSSVSGMFLLAKLYLDSLQGKPSVKAIKTSLGKIRSKSNDSNIYKRAYEGAMERIEHQIVDQATLAKRVLSWLTCARRSLTLTELQHALAVEINETSFDEENLPDIEDMISACAGLVTYNEQSHIITLVHYTTQEYFEQEWTSLFPNAHRDIGQVCLTYVCYDVFASTSYKNDEKRFEYEERLEKYPLYAYAATSWGYHAKQQPLGPPEVVLKLLENGEKSAACGYAQAVGSHESNVLFDESTGSTGLHLAASFGLRAEVEALLEKTRQPDITDSWKETPLFTAVREGHEEVVRILLHHGANPCLQDDVGKTPLSLAAEFGHESLVDLFLELGLDPNVTDKMGWSPLHHAAQEGRLAVVRFLLNKGAQLDPTTPREDLLPWAASHNCTSLIEILLDEGGDINQRDSQNGCTPLSYAVMHGYDLLATLLLKKGANPGSKDKFGRTTLFHALERRYVPFGRKMIPQVILEKYPNLLHYRDDFGRSPILLAAENRQDAILQAIANGREHSVILSMEMETVLCTIRAPGYVLSQDKGEFLMLWAAVHGYLTVINFLLEKGINHLFQDVRGRTPLLLAAKNCHWEVFRAFSNRGLILHVQDKQGYSPLSWAFQARHEVIIQLLFENGADPNEPIKDPDDRYNYRAEAPLFLAVRRESESIVGFLLKIGADPNHFKYETGRCDRIEGESTPSKDIENIVSPLSLAAGKGYHGIVAAFLNNGANLFVCHIALREAMMNGNHSIVSLIMEKGIRDNWIIAEHGESLLYHAASTGYIDVVRILLEKGVNPNSRNSNSIKRSFYLSGVRDGIWERGTPLCCAANCGNIEIARLLLSRNTDPTIASSLFCAAIEHNYLEMAELLLQHVAELNDLNAAALFEGLRRGHHNMVELLLAKRIPPEPKHPKAVLSILLFSAVSKKAHECRSRLAEQRSES